MISPLRHQAWRWALMPTTPNLYRKPTLFGSPSAVSCDDASAPRSSNNCSRGVPCGSPRCLMASSLAHGHQQGHPLLQVGTGEGSSGYRGPGFRVQGTSLYPSSGGLSGVNLICGYASPGRSVGGGRRGVNPKIRNYVTERPKRRPMPPLGWGMVARMLLPPGARETAHSSAKLALSAFAHPS